MAGRAAWAALSQQAWDAVQQWREAHPQARLAEIERAVDETLARLRAQMIQETAVSSAAREVSGGSVGERPVGLECGGGLEWVGTRSRRVTTRQEQAITLERSYGPCPRCHTGLFPPG